MPVWKDEVKKRYPWAKIQNQIDELYYELSKAEDEEDIELSMLGLQIERKVDFDFFTKKEKQKVKKLMSILIEDTRKHGELLRKALNALKKAGEQQ